MKLLLHILGAAMLVAVGAAAGMGRSALYRRRRVALEELGHLLQLLKGGILYRRLAFAQLWQDAYAQRQAFSVLHIPPPFSQGEEGDPRAAFLEGLACRTPGFSELFSAPDLAALQDCVMHLGEAGAEEACSRLDACAASLAWSLEKAREEERRNGRLYTTLGLCAGAAAAILLV